MTSFFEINEAGTASSPTLAQPMNGVSGRKSVAIPSLIKWTGSKRSQAGRIMELAPARYDRFIEPFVGGGALLYLAAVPGSIAGDVYAPLIGLWKLLQSEPERVVDSYREHWAAASAELDTYDLSALPKTEPLPRYFYKVRTHFNQHSDPLDLNFILRTCVNGIVRFNDKGEFNNSFHLSRRGMQPDKFATVIRQWSDVLKHIQFHCQGFDETLAMAKPGDFVYMDPPYAGNKQRYIDDLDVDAFFDELDNLNRRGVKWALSFDGHRGEANLVYDVPASLYKRHVLLSNGSSAVNRVLNGAVEDLHESLYLNY